MRLPWPFGRRTLADGPPSAATEAGGAGAPLAHAAPPSLAAPPTGAWAGLPPIQRTVGTPPLVAPSAPFLGEVSGVRPLPPIVEPLGHEASMSGPPGLVVAHARPVPSLTSGAPLPPRPVQRRAARADDAAPDPLEVPAAQPEPEPARRLAIVPPGTGAIPPDRPLTRTAPTLAPLAPGGTRRPGATPSAASPAASGPPLQRAAAGQALPSPGSQAGPGSDPGSPAGAAGRSRWSEAAPAGSRPGLGAPIASSVPDLEPRPQAAPGSARRRAGLGSPLAIPPASAVAQRLPTAGPARPTTPGAHAVGAPMGSESARPATAADQTPSSAPLPTRAGRLPVLHVARRRSDEGATPAAPPTTAATMTPGGTAATRTVRPTMGLRPIHSSLTAQREPAAPGDAVSDGGPSAIALPVPARWEVADDLPPSVVGPTGGRPFAMSNSAVQLTPLVQEPSAPGGERGQPDGMREIRFPSRDGGPASTASARLPGSTVAQGLMPGPGARSATAGFAGSPAAVRTGIGRALTGEPGRPLTLARSTASGAGSAPASGTAAAGAAGTVVGRIVADPVSPSAPPTVQASRGGETAGTPVAAITATPVVQRVEGAPPAAGGQAEHSDTELDELARALFGRIRSHLRAEVIHEREAKGLTFDAF